MKVYFSSLGCDKNLVDSEKMLGLLTKAGFEVTDEPEEAEVAVVNSCCFIGDAKEESIETIIELGKYKETGRLQVLAVCGCLAQRYREEIAKDLPEVDVLIGTSAIDKIVPAIKDALGGKRRNVFKSIHSNPVLSPNERVLTTGGHFAYLKIAEGCNKRCSYCVIPSVKGNYRSIPMEDIIYEALHLASMGVKELILIAQETTVYGTDIYGKKYLPRLLRKLCAIDEIQWIRLLYCYPEEITEELITVIKEEPKVCHYIDMPIQHGDDSILRAMGRAATQDRIRTMVARLREEIPDIAIRTTIITGFPGETQEQFENCYRFVNEMEFDRLGVFTYSPEDGTVAAMMPNQIPEEIKEQRREELMILQQEITAEKNQEKVGKTIRVMIEGYMPEDHVYAARSHMDAPDVDGLVFVNSDRELMTGEFVLVNITQATEYDLIGDIYDESAQ